MRISDRDRADHPPSVARRRLKRRATTVALLLAMAPFGYYAVSAAVSSLSSVKYVYGTKQYLPVRSGEGRYMSDPYGDVAQIRQVAAATKRLGSMSLARPEGVLIPNQWRNRTFNRYDLTIPTSSGDKDFSYFEGSGFSGLGYHLDGKIVLDVFEGGGPATGPRLWGAYDQVINEAVPLRMLVGDPEEDGFGLMKASYLVGLVADMPKDKQQRYGDSYVAAVQFAVEALDAGHVQPAESTAGAGDTTAARQTADDATLTAEVKTEIVLAIWRGDLTREDARTRYGVTAGRLHDWIRTAEDAVIRSLK